jgi:hypothetical protein
MKAPSDGWDSDEREALASDELARQLAVAQARHTLGAEGEARILASVRRDAHDKPTRRAAGGRWWIPLASVAALILAGTIWLATPRTPSSESNTPPQPAAPVPAPPLVFRLPLEKPAIKISPSALAWRGPGRENPLLADLKPAFDAFRADDYQRADDEFSKLAGKYPQSIEVPFHQGVSRLLGGNAQAATVSLKAAERLADSSFAWDVQWYLAVAEERAGDAAAARARLTRLCGQPDSRQHLACDAVKKFPN